MSISAIQATASPEYLSPYRRPTGTVADLAGGNRNTGPDTVSFSEDALRMARGQAGGESDSGEDDLSFTDRLGAEETLHAGKSGASVSEQGKKSLFAMLLESLFLAELEESAAANAEADAAGNDQADQTGQTGQGDMPRQQARTTSSVNPLEDGGKVAEIKKVLTDFAKGKADLSDLPKAMAVANSGSGGARGVKSVASRHEGDNSASAGNKDKEHTVAG